MIINIYALVNPSNNEIIYVGQTKLGIKKRLDQHYWKLNEAKKGKRSMTKLFKFLDNYLPLKVKIKLLRIIDTEKPFENADFLEQYYINHYRTINPNLLNESDGGIGGFVWKNKSDKDKNIIKEKISKANKGKKKPEGFGKNLSIKRKGANNPMAKKLNIGIYDKNKNLIYICNYGFEVNEFLKDKWFWSNNSRLIRNGFAGYRFGYMIKLIV